MVTTRMYKNQDYEKILAFLTEMYAINKNQHCWLPSRWEYAEHLVNPLYMERGYSSWEKFIKIWEDHEQIIGISHPEDTHNAFIQVRPGYRYLELEMIEWAEFNIAKTVNAGKMKKIVIWVNDSDTYRKDLLKERGYKKGEECNYLNVQNLDKEFQPQVPDGYCIRSMIEDIDLVKRFNVIHKAFHPNEDYKCKVSNSFLQMINAPMYRPDLDIVVEYKDGSLVSSCTIWFDKQNNIGMFEPVGTHPDHQGKGLGREILLEGLKRLKKIGAQKAYVESFGDRRYSFYKSVGFQAYDKDYPWEKVF